MINQIKKIKLLKLYTDNNIFDPVEFKEGINIILGEKYDSATTSGSKTNGVGKSILIEFLNFCLLSKYQNSRLQNIPANIFPEKENIHLDLLIGDKKYTITRNRLKEESPIITVNGSTTTFPTLKETTRYLTSIVFEKENLETSPSLRSLLSIIIRDENSEFKDIAKPYDLTKRIPEDYSPHLYLLHLSLDPYQKINEILKNLKIISAVLQNEKKELTSNGTKDFSQVKAENNNLENQLKILGETFEEYKTADGFKILEEDISKLEVELREKSSELKVLRYQLNVINSMPKVEQIDAKDVEVLYNSYKKSLGTLIVKSLEEATNFKNKIEYFQRTILEDKKNEILKEINSLNKEKNVIDDEYSKKIKILDTKGTFQNLKVNLNIYEEKRTSLNKTISLLESYNKHDSEKKNLMKEKQKELDIFEELLNEQKSKIDSFQDTILSIHEYIMGNRECSFELLVNNKPSLQTNPLKINLRIFDDGSHGIDRTKVFIYDIALLFNDLTRKRHPLFLVHDNIFETDENTMVMCLNYINSKTNDFAHEFQYIITLNKDSIEKNGELVKGLELDIKKNTVGVYTKINKFLKKDYQEKK